MADSCVSPLPFTISGALAVSLPLLAWLFISRLNDPPLSLQALTSTMKACSEDVFLFLPGNQHFDKFLRSGFSPLQPPSISERVPRFTAFRTCSSVPPFTCFSAFPLDGAFPLKKLRSTLAWLPPMRPRFPHPLQILLSSFRRIFIPLFFLVEDITSAAVYLIPFFERSNVPL